MTGENVSTILDAELALEETLNQVAPCAKYAYDESQSHPLQKRKLLLIEVPQHDSHHYAEYATAYAAHPRLVGRYTLEEFCGEALVKQRTTAVGSRIARPEEEEYAQRVDGYELGMIGHRIVAPSQHVEQRKTQSYVDLRSKCITPIL